MKGHPGTQDLNFEVLDQGFLLAPMIRVSAAAQRNRLWRRGGKGGSRPPPLHLARRHAENFGQGLTAQGHSSRCLTLICPAWHLVVPASIVTFQFSSAQSRGTCLGRGWVWAGCNGEGNITRWQNWKAVFHAWGVGNMIYLGLVWQKWVLSPVFLSLIAFPNSPSSFDSLYSISARLPLQSPSRSYFCSITQSSQPTFISL